MLRSQKSSVRQKQNNPFSWYNSDTKKMVHQTGGRMELRYDPSTKKLKPQVVDEFHSVRESNYPAIQNWIRSNNHVFDMSVIQERPGHWIVLDVNKNQLDDITEDLYRHKIQYDYE